MGRESDDWLFQQAVISRIEIYERLKLLVFIEFLSISAHSRPSAVEMSGILPIYSAEEPKIVY